MSNLAKLCELEALKLEAQFWIRSATCPVGSYEVDRKSFKDCVAKIRALAASDDGEWEYRGTFRYQLIDGLDQSNKDCNYLPPTNEPGWQFVENMDHERGGEALWRRWVKKNGVGNPVAKARNALFDLIARSESEGLEVPVEVRSAYELLDKLVELKDRCD